MVWYSIFCTLMDAHKQGGYDDAQVVNKLVQLREELRRRLPSVEAALLGGK